VAAGGVLIGFVELPIVAYELGYLADTCHPERIRHALELSLRA